MPSLAAAREKEITSGARLNLMSDGETRNSPGDWAMRIGVAGFYFVSGLEKFSSSELHWVKLFQEIGAGNWFRYSAGIVEIAGALLVLIPQTAVIGLALLATTMAAAALILAVTLGRPGDSLFPGAFCIMLAALAWNRWKAGQERRKSTPSDKRSGQTLR
jgi:putative oxidoreductase